MCYINASLEPPLCCVVRLTAESITVAEKSVYCRAFFIYVEVGKEEE
jgi:hypothetical protein